MYGDCRLLLGMNGCMKGRKHFHFKAFWTQLPGFNDKVAELWQQPTRRPQAGPLERLAEKFKHLAHDLQSWSQKKHW